MSWKLIFALAFQFKNFAPPQLRSGEGEAEAGRACRWSKGDLTCNAQFRSGEDTEDDMEEVVFSMSKLEGHVRSIWEEV